MTNFDEYQKFTRYKYGHHAFFIVLVLTVINYFLSTFLDIQWAETKELEMILLIFVTNIYALIMMVYHGAYFSKKQNTKRYAILFFLVGVFNLYVPLSPYTPLITDGQLTANSIVFLAGILFTSVPITILIKSMIEKRRVKVDEEYE